MTRSGGGLAQRLAAIVVRLRVVIVVGWIAAAVVVGFVLPTIREAQVGGLGDLVPTDAAAIEAEIRASELFGFPLLSRTLVVQRAPDGLSRTARARITATVVALNRGTLPEAQAVGGALAVTNGLLDPPLAREQRSTTAVTYLYFPPEVGQSERIDAAHRVAELLAAAPGSGEVGVTGALAARAAQAEAIGDRLPLIELATLVLVLVVVGLHFRAVGAALANLAAVAIAFLVSIRLVAWIGKQIGVSVPAEVEPIVVVLLFGVMTDYTIFFLSRFRRRLGEGLDPRAAAERATADLLPIIATCGLTVAGASAALVVAELGFFRAFGPGMAMAMLIALLVALTFVPAVLSIAGRWIFWPARPAQAHGADSEGERGLAATTASSAGVRGVGAEAGRGAAEDPPPLGRTSWTARLAVARPVATIAACLAALALAASGALGLHLGNSLIRGLPPDAEARQAYQRAKPGLAPGLLSPTVLILERESIGRDTAALRRLQQLLASEPGVAVVAGPALNPTEVPLGAVVSRNGDAARYVLVLEADPLGAGAINRLRILRGRLDRLLAEAGLQDATLSIAGDTALSQETIARSIDDLVRVVPAVLVVVFAILAVFLRGLVAPLYLVGSALLAPLAALGITTVIFQHLLGHGELTYYVPIAAAVLLVALGSDYNVFMIGRIWQEARRRPLREAVLAGATGAGPAIGAAAFVLAASFALLALVPLRAFGELACMTSVGLLIDAFVVRSLLIPALVVLLGKWSSPPRASHRAAPAAPATARG